MKLLILEDERKTDAYLTHGREENALNLLVLPNTRIALRPVRDRAG
ncbi:MAG: hypothetical protein ACRETR_10200 [Steroidobacteraceae bacterium]